MNVDLAMPIISIRGNKMSNIKYGLTGFARSGKDTVAQMILKHRPELKTYALAAPIKETINALVGLEDEVAETYKDLDLVFHIDAQNQEDASCIYYQATVSQGKLAPPIWEFWDMLETRKLIEFNPDTSTYIYKGSLRQLYQLFGTEFGRSIDPDIWLNVAPEGALITDIRFPNEAEYFLDKGYKIVRVVRDTKEYKILDHSSEAGVPEGLVTSTLMNTESLESLELTVKHMLLGE